jgi:predicted dehydrogenase
LDQKEYDLTVSLHRSPSFLLVGLGSIGKTHLKYILGNSGNIVVIDPNVDVLRYLELQNLTSSIKYFSSFESYQHEESPEIAVIANWGPDHFSTIQKLRKLGVKLLMVEKPLVSKLQDLEELKKAISNGDLKIITNMPISQGPLAMRVQELQLNKKLGKVQTILVSGGAKCLVTNGVHYIGLASKIFQSWPLSVVSSIESHTINPRSIDFVFAEGNSTWQYGNGKNLSVSFSNNSHVQLSINIICEYGKIVIEEDLATVYCISETDHKKIDQPTRTFYAREILETFKPYHYASGLDGMGYLYDRIQSSDPDVWNDFEHGFRATEAVIGMLISSETCSKVELPIRPEIKEKYNSRDWNIS